MAQRLLLKISSPEPYGNRGKRKEKEQQRCRLSSYLFMGVHLAPHRQRCMRTSDDSWDVPAILSYTEPQGAAVLKAVVGLWSTNLSPSD